MKPEVLVVAAVIRKAEEPHGPILIVRRGPQQSNSGFWEFPGGKVETGESPEAALIREIHEELRLDIKVLEYLGQEKWQAGAKVIVLKVFESEVQDFSKLKLIEHDACLWQMPDQIDPQLLSVPDRPFLEQLKRKTKV